jgi:hypothetical protein
MTDYDKNDPACVAAFNDGAAWQAAVQYQADLRHEFAKAAMAGVLAGLLATSKYNNLNNDVLAKQCF